MLRILVVCTANVCRSQYARMMLLDNLRDHADLSHVLVQSSGTRVSKAAEPCEHVLHRLDAQPVSIHQRPTRPRSITDVGVEKADLILTAEAAHRSVIARLEPETRGHTFTMREAVHYLANDRESGRLEDMPTLPFDQRFAWVVARMNASRGLFPIAVAPQRRFRASRRPLDNGLDIADNHNLQNRLHEDTLSEVKETMVSLGTHLKAIF